MSDLQSKEGELQRLNETETPIEKMSDFSFAYSATDTQLHNFYEKWKHVVWQVRVNGKPQVHTAFALDASGILMTCAHVIPKTHSIIYVRSLEQEDCHYCTAEILEVKREWDMVLLRVNDVKNCSYARLSDGGKLSVDQTVVHIGHANNLLYSFVVGKVAHKCLDSPPIPTGETISCDEYHPTSPMKRDHPILGDLNMSNRHDTLRERIRKEEAGEGNKDYRLPIVLTYPCGAKTGSPGGPVFDGKGDVVGMHITSSRSLDIALHVSVLRVFFDGWKTKVAHQVGGSD